MSATRVRALRARRGRCPTARLRCSSRADFRDERNLEMRDVVDPADQHSTISFLEQGDGCILDLEREQAAAWPADHAMQRNLDHAAMRHHEHIALLMATEDVIQRSSHTSVEVRRAFATR